MIGNALTINQARKMIDDGIWAMFVLFESFHYEEINKYLEEHNANIDAGELDTLVYGLLQEMTSDLLDIKEKEILKSVRK